MITSTCKPLAIIFSREELKVAPFLRFCLPQSNLSRRLWSEADFRGHWERWLIDLALIWLLVSSDSTRRGGCWVSSEDENERFVGGMGLHAA